MRVLAAGAHPDDIELFMGGAMFAWKAMGAELHFVVATDGARGGVAETGELARVRAAEAGRSAERFGAQLHLAGFPDGGLIADKTTIAAFQDLVATIRPDIAVTHAENDYHADHRALNAIMRQAVGFSVPLLCCDTLIGTGFLPTHYVDISEYFEEKCLAIRDHESQDPLRFVDWCRLQNAFRAAQCGQFPNGYAEAYRFEPVYPFADIRALLPPAPPVRPVAGRASHR